jgi:hypothetical protein
MKQAVLFVTFLGATIAGGAALADPTTPVPTFDQALADAKAKGKPLVLEFWASW